MEIQDFKKRFLTISEKDKMKAISEMENADVKKDHCRSLPEDQHETVIKEFAELIDWCKSVMRCKSVMK
jgi:hypothetical protein